MTNLSGHLTDAQAQRLLDQQLQPDRDLGVADHAAECAECAALVESFRLLGRALDDLDLPALPEDFTAGVLARIDRAEARVARERRSAALVMVAVLLGSAGALVAIGVGGLGVAVGSWAETLGAAARALRIGSGVLPGLVSALRFQILLATAAVAVPLLVGLTRLIPAHRAETA